MNDLMEIFKTGQVVVHCLTERSYENFIDICYANDLIWAIGREPYRESNPCIRFDGDFLVRGNKDYYKSVGKRIIEFR